MGIEESQKKAQLLIDKALAILQELPFETSKLEFLCQLIINRKS
jgi:geranylgeranyl pyrophosphate synthase